MKKYLSIFKISFQQEFAYKLNFIMWRVRNILQILIFFFLWSAVFEGSEVEVFGYTEDKILTYGFVLILIRAIALSSRSVDIAGQISNGELSNLILKPINYFKYWITRDLSSKFLNMIFAAFEIVILI
ncbi:ABC-2 family transporter protein, partial [Candidatus Microgenomates bacterium]|nr:ABC-2 family transporter protein [Candidatus Microgenomates bacterium]